LETHTDETLASDREIELQKQYGYKVDLVRYDAVDYKSIGLKYGSHNKGGAPKTPVIATNIYTNESRVFDSQMHASRELGFNQCSIAQNLKMGYKQTHGWKFRYL
jgi:hypothetical protein